MKTQYRFLIGILLFGTINQKAASELAPEIVSMAEINVLDYPFMKDIANFIRQTETDKDKIFPQYDNPQYEAEYSIEIDFGKCSRVEDIPFYVNGTYSIQISLSPCAEAYLFDVDGVHFHTSNTLVPYFNSCKIKKVNMEAFKNGEAFWYYFWFFEVKEGKVVDAVYFYEPVDDGFDEYDVYDLIQNKYIPYKVWDAKIHPTK